MVAEDARDDGEQQGEEGRPVEIDVGVGAEGKVVLDGDEVQVEGAELVEGVGHSHATRAGPALVVAVEAEVEEAGVESDEGECGDCQPECCGLEQSKYAWGFLQRDSNDDLRVDGINASCGMAVGCAKTARM